MHLNRIKPSTGYLSGVFFCLYSFDGDFGILLNNSKDTLWKDN